MSLARARKSRPVGIGQMTERRETNPVFRKALRVLGQSCSRQSAICFPTPRGSRDIMRSLRGWLLILWLMLVVSAAVTGYLLIGSFRQSAAAQVGRAQEAVARSCRDIADRYVFATTGWTGPKSSQIDEELRRQLTVVVETALARTIGVEGGIWQSQAGPLAYAFPTYEGTGPKTDLPEAERAVIEQVNAEARTDEHAAAVRRPSQTQTLLLYACPLPGPLSGATAWTMTRVFTGSGHAYHQLVAGLGVLVFSVVGYAESALESRPTQMERGLSGCLRICRSSAICSVCGRHLSRHPRRCGRRP
jgi:hypothetical protein